MNTANHPKSDGSRRCRSRAFNGRPASACPQRSVIVDTVATGLDPVTGLAPGAFGSVAPEHTLSAKAVLYALLWVSACVAPAHATPNGKTLSVPRWLCSLPQSSTGAESRTTNLAALATSGEQAASALFQTRQLAPSLSAVPLPTPSRAQFQPPSTLNSVVGAGSAGRTIQPKAKSARRAVAARPVAKKTARAPQSTLKPAAVRLAQTPRHAPMSVTVTPVPAPEMPVASLPAAQIPLSSLPSAPDAGESLATGLPGMRKIINVSALKLPPASQPLDPKLRARAISADAPFLAPSLPRMAQNPAAPPLTQPARPVTNSDRLPNQIEVAVSTFVVLLTTTDLQTVAVADPNIADVAVVNSRSVLVNGKTPGVTSLVVVDRLKIRQYQVRVTPAPGARTSDITQQIGIPGVTVRQVRDSLILEGEVGTTEESRRAEQIAGAFTTRVINQLSVRDAVGADAGLASQIQSTINLPDVRVRIVGETAFIDGQVENVSQYQRADTVARALVKNVVNLLQLPTLTVEQIREAIVGANPTASDSAVALDPIIIRQAGDQLILEGTLPSAAQLDQALATAQRSGLQVVNRLQVAAAPTQDNVLLSAVERAIGRPGVRVRGTAKRMVIEGVVPDTNAAVAVEQITRAFATEVDNLLQTPNPVIVNVDISIVEINRNDAKNLGVQIGSAALLSETITATPPTVIPGVAGGTGGAPIPPTVIPGGTQREVTIDPTVTQGLFGFGEDVTGSFRNLNPLRVRLDALYANGRARLLSNPRTTVLSGRTATFQVGGQVPFPAGSTSGAGGTTSTIEFKDYGILLDIIPIANTNGVVTMRVRSEVSAPDFATAVTPPGGGSPIPGFTRRSTVTEVTVRPNGTLALSGLIQNEERREISRVPVLSRIPILGQLFKSKRFINNESELVIFVQPTVQSNMLPPGTTAPASPVAVGNTTNVAATTGNPGIRTFDVGGSVAGGGEAAGGGGQ